MRNNTLLLSCPEVRKELCQMLDDADIEPPLPNQALKLADDMEYYYEADLHIAAKRAEYDAAHPTKRAAPAATSFHTKLVMFLMICTNVGATDPTGFRYGTCLLNERSNLTLLLHLRPN